ncbi:hypothetical protein FRC07_010294, partial [Ceratobasidium sp. 392]
PRSSLLFAVPMSSFLYKPPQRNKPSTSRQFRVSRAPYALPTSGAHSSSFLLSGSSSVSGRTLDKRTREIRSAYEATLNGYTPAEKHELNVLRGEIGWMPPEDDMHDAVSPLDNAEDSDDEWLDEDNQPLNFVSVELSGRVCANPLAQSWSERIAREKYAWDQHMSSLCDAFLAFTRNGAPSRDNTHASSGSTFTVLCINLTSKEKIEFSSPNVATPAVQTLIRHGYLSPTPSSPTVAIHVDLLRYCVALRRHASIISLQGIASAICEVHNVRFENEVKNKTKQKAGTSGQGQSGTSQSREGTHIEKVAHTTAHADASESSCVDLTALPGGDIDDEEGKPCEQRWKNARADHESGKKLVVFDETGIFVVSCRHGTVMLVEDMRRSGEL